MTKKSIKHIIAGLALFGSVVLVGACGSTSEEEPEVKDTYSIELVFGEWTMNCYEDVTLSATTSKNGEAITSAITWQSSNPDVAKIDENGYVIAYKEGEATITATANDVSDTCTLTVLEASGIPQLIVDSEEEIALSMGTTYQLQPYILYNGKQYEDVELTYNSSNPQFASISNNGLLTATEMGESTITVAGAWRGLAGVSITESVAIKVGEHVNIQLLDVEQTEIYTTDKDLGDGQSYFTSITYGVSVQRNHQEITDTATYTWKTTDSSVATVDQNGAVTAVSAGEAGIYVEYTSPSENVYTSDVVYVTVKFPVLEHNFDLVVGAQDTNIVLDSETFFGEEGEIVSITDVTSVVPTSVSIENGKITGGVIENNENRTRIWQISNGEYAYQTEVFVATSVIRSMDQFMHWFAFNTTTASYQSGVYGYFVLDGNIDASNYKLTHGGVFAPNSNGLSGLQGTFDGRGFTIDGLTVCDGGLFGYVNNGGVIKNLALTDVKIETSSEAYVFTYQSYNMQIDNVLVEISQFSIGNTIYNQALYEIGTGDAKITNTIVMISAQGTEAYCLDGAWDYVASSYAYEDTYVISSLTSVSRYYGNTLTGVEKYSNAEAFVSDTEKDLSGFNDYWDFTGNTPAFKTMKS